MIDKTLQLEADAQLEIALKDVANRIATDEKGRYSQYFEIEPAKEVYSDLEKETVIQPAVLGFYSNAGFLTGAVFTSTVSVYDGPSGTGYLVIATVTQGKDVWQRIVDVGPEKRDQDWTEVMEAV